jgi:hypothetical protein
MDLDLEEFLEWIKKKLPIEFPFIFFGSIVIRGLLIAEETLLMLYSTISKTDLLVAFFSKNP